jgi:transposase
MTVDEVERRLIVLTLEKTAGNKTKAAKLLGVSLKTLHNKLRRYREEGILADPAGETPMLASPESLDGHGAEGDAEDE